MYLLYNLLLTLAAPIWVPLMFLRSLRRKQKPNWRERVGQLPVPRDANQRRIWFHAVSVGENIAARPILKAIRQRLPGHQIILSVTTPGGHEAAEQTPELYDYLVYFPLDVARFTLGAMQLVQPEVVAVMETELWYNFLWAAKVFDAKTLLINGRISDRSFPRSRRLLFFYRSLLGFLDKALMQTEEDARRIRILGARDVEVLGNSKYDQQAPLPAVGLWPGSGPKVVIGSTRGAAEEAFVLDALDLLPGHLRSAISIVHAPRHIERAEALVDLASARGWEASRRSKGGATRFLVLDTYGELTSYYLDADVVVMGGGFADLGGQNIIQPLAAGKPVIHGPHMQNFRQAAIEADAAGIAFSVDSQRALATELLRLLEDTHLREDIALKARAFMDRNVGASERYAAAIAEAAAEFFLESGRQV